MSGWAVAGQIAGELVGGQMQQNALDSQNDQSIRANVRASRLAHRRQVNFYKRQIQWKVADARKAGIHPLAALGIQAAPYTPMHGGGGGNVTGDAMSDAVRNSSRIAAQHFDPEMQSRTRLNNAQASVLEQQAQDSLIARTAQAANHRQDVFAHRENQQQKTPGIHVAGLPIKTYTGSADAQTFEDRYGELGGAAMGLVNLPLDVLYTVYDALSGPASKLHRDIKNSELFRDVRSFQ